MFKLEQNAKLKKHTGELSHDDIHGRTPYNHFTTHIGSKIHIQRPSLEEYVLLMPRSATITYPKDIWVMMGMIDIGAGATVVEAGTGSGALTLYLSRLGKLIDVTPSTLNIILQYPVKYVVCDSLINTMCIQVTMTTSIIIHSVSV